MSSGIIAASIAIIVSTIALALLFRVLYRAKMLTKTHSIISFVILMAIFCFGSYSFIAFDSLIAIIIVGVLAIAFMTMFSIFTSLDTKYRSQDNPEKTHVDSEENASEKQDKTK